jgi:hypothetical protein
MVKETTLRRRRALRNRPSKAFGTKAWLAGALTQKFRKNQDGTQEKLSSVADYLGVHKLRAKLWPEPGKPREIIWVDPGLDDETDLQPPV